MSLPRDIHDSSREQCSSNEKRSICLELIQKEYDIKFVSWGSESISCRFKRRYRWIIYYQKKKKSVSFLDPKKSRNQPTDSSFENRSQDVPPKSIGNRGIGIPSGELLLAFTCKKCETRCVKRFHRHSYYHGIVIVQCPGCRGKHLLADHLGWFENEKRTIEDVLKERGEKVDRVSLQGLLTIE